MLVFVRLVGSEALECWRGRKHIKQKVAAWFSQPLRPTRREKHTRRDAATPFFPFSLDTCEALCWQSAQRWHSDHICNHLRSFDFDASHIQEFHIKSIYAANIEKIKEILALLWVRTVLVPSFRLTSVASHPWLCYYRVVMLF